jgi:hypothetical protein
MNQVLFCLLFFGSLAFAETNSVDLPVKNTTRIENRAVAQLKEFKRRSSVKRPRKKRFKTYKSINSSKFKNYKIAEIPDYKIPPFLSREDLNKIVPTNVAGDSSDVVLKKMGDKAVNVWLKSSAMQQVSLVQAAQKVEQAMHAEVDLAPEGSDVKHKLNFQMQAFQTTSKVDYTGYVDATISFNMRDQKTGYEVRRKVLHNKDLFVSHSESKNENLSSVGLKWGF